MKAYLLLLFMALLLVGCGREETVRDQAALAGKDYCAEAGGMKYLTAPSAGEWSQQTYFEAHCRNGQIVAFRKLEKGP